MAYIGPKPSQTLATPTSQYFNGTGSQTVFTLNRAVNVPEDLEVFVNNIQQEPGVGKSYTATGTTLTFDAAPSSGTANVYVVYRGLAEVTTRLEHDPNAALAATTGTFSGNVDVTGVITTDGMTTSADINFGDNDKAIFGAGSDLQIFHDGSNSYVKDAGTGDLYLQGSNNVQIESAAGANMIYATAGAQVRLFYNGSPKFNTTSTGVDVTGVITTDGLTTSGDINFGDNDKAIFGAGSDLQIYHDGSHSYISDQGTGDLKIIATNFEVNNAANTENIIKGVADGEVEIYHNGSAKLATTATGVDVTGTVTADGLTVDGTLTVNGTGGQITTDNNGFITSKQSLDTTTAGGRFIGKSNRGELGQIAIEQTATGTDGGYIRFSTSPSGSTSPTERMRITSEGYLFYGTTSNVGTGSLGVAIDAGDNFMIRHGMSGTATQDRMRFYNSNGLMGWIQTTGSACTYNSASDYRLKENVTADWDATTRLKQLNPVRFNFTFEPDTTVDGFLAHEVQDVVPEAISGTHNGMRDEEYEVTPAVLDEDGNEVTPAVMGTRSVPDYQGIDQSKLVPLLVKTIQELEARIAALETA